jgi:hypothetical protein
VEVECITTCITRGDNMKKFLMFALCLLFLLSVNAYAADDNWTKRNDSTVVTKTSEGSRIVISDFSGAVYGTQVDPNNFMIDFRLNSVPTQWLTISLLKENDMFINATGMTFLFSQDGAFYVKDYKSGFNGDLWGDSQQLFGFGIKNLTGKEMQERHKLEVTKVDSKWEVKLDGQVLNFNGKDFSFDSSFYNDGKAYLEVDSMGADVIIYEVQARAKSTEATVSSVSYTVDNTAETITGVAENTSLADFKTKIVPAAGASFEVYKADGTTVATELTSGCKLITTAEDGKTKKIYIITILDPEKVLNSDTTVTTTTYTVNNSELTISNIPANTTVADFKSKLSLPTGARVEIYKADGTTIATELATNYKAIVVAEDNITQSIYTLKLVETNTDNTTTDQNQNTTTVDQHNPKTSDLGVLPFIAMAILSISGIACVRRK